MGKGLLEGWKPTVFVRLVKGMNMPLTDPGAKKGVGSLELRGFRAGTDGEVWAQREGLEWNDSLASPSLPCAVSWVIAQPDPVRALPHLCLVSPAPSHEPLHLFTAQN